MHRTRALVALGMVAATLAGCATSALTSDPVLASFYPMQYLAARIADGHLSVGVLVPPGTEPHEYDLKPSDAARIERAKVVVYNGAGFEAFASKIGEIANPRAFVVEASRGVVASGDPHAWLDPLDAIAEAENVETALERADPANRTRFAAGFAALAKDLHDLDAEYRQGLASCENRKILTSHAAFGHLARRYNFTEFAISGLEPDAEPSAAKVKEAAEIARREGIRVVFFETLVSPRVAETIAREVHGTTAVLDPIEGLTSADAAAGKDYLSLMRANLHALEEAMRCA